MLVTLMLKDMTYFPTYFISTIQSLPTPVLLSLSLALLPLIYLLLVPLTSSVTFWLTPKFVIHRVGGAFFLLQLVWAWWLFFTDTPRLMESPVMWMLPLTSVTQAVSASLTFTFLPPDTKNSNAFYGDKGVLSKAFVRENIFYQLLTAFGFLYYQPRYHQQFFMGNGGLFATVVEIIFVFLPYVLLRPFFPTTRFRDALGTNNASAANHSFFTAGIWIIKFFYVIFKHLGFLLQYLAFMHFDSANPTHRTSLIGFMLANVGTVSCSIFLHTLKFKGIVGPKLSYAIYVVMAYAPLAALPGLISWIIEHPLILALTVLGMVLNFAPSRVWYSYQITLAFLFFAVRYGYISHQQVPL